MPKNDSDQNDSAAKDKKNKKNKKDKKKKGGCLIPIILFVILLAVAVAFMVLDLFGLRTQYVSGILDNIPVVGNLLGGSEEGTGEEPQRMSAAELQAAVDDLTRRLEDTEAELDSEREKSAMYVDEISRLREFEAVQEQFRLEKEQFDRMIAESAPNDFIQFFEGMSQENTQVLLEEMLLSEQRRVELRNYVRTIESMEERSAARLLEELLPADMDLVVLVLNNINIETRGEILGAMDTANAASIYKQMAPEE